jgi:succinyl-CoA synthetase beta subunit
VLKVSLKVPVIVRLEGTNVDQGKRILKVNLKLNLMSNLWTEIHNVMRIIFDKLDRSVVIYVDH